MIFFGFFACGYQLAFLTAHFPAMVTEMCSAITPSSALHFIGISSTSSLGALAIGLIAFSNIFGTIYAGWLGQKFPKKYLLAGVYALRALIGLIFILLPFVEMFYASLRPLDHLFRSPYQFFSDDLSFWAYREMWNTVPMLPRYIFNSFFLATVTSLITLLFVIPAAYSYARFNFPFKNDCAMCNNTFESKFQMQNLHL